MVSPPVSYADSKSGLSRYTSAKIPALSTSGYTATSSSGAPWHKSTFVIIARAMTLIV